MLKIINPPSLTKIPHFLVSALLITQTACLTQFPGLQVDSNRFKESSPEVDVIDPISKKKGDKEKHKFYAGPMPIRHMLAFYDLKITQEGNTVTAAFTIRNNLSHAAIELSNIKAVLQQKGTNLATAVLKGSIAPGDKRSVQVHFDQLESQVNSEGYFDIQFYAKDTASAIAIVKQWSLSQKKDANLKTGLLKMVSKKTKVKIKKIENEYTLVENKLKEYAAEEDSCYMGKVSTQDKRIINIVTDPIDQVGDSKNNKTAEIKLPLKSTLLKIVDTRITKREKEYSLAITFKNKLASKFNMKGLAVTVIFPNQEFLTNNFFAKDDNYIESKETQEIRVPLNDKQTNITDPGKVKFIIEVHAKNKQVALRMWQDWFTARKSEVESGINERGRTESIMNADPERIKELTSNYTTLKEYLEGSSNLPKDALFITNAFPEVTKKVSMKGFTFCGPKRTKGSRASRLFFWRRKK